MADESLSVVGVIGVGKMGGPMCRRLLAAGYPVVVHNRTAARMTPFVASGATAADSPAALASLAAVILTCLDTIAASESVYLGSDGVVAHARPGTLLIEHSTIAPALVRRIADATRARGLDFVDAPVSGGPEGAEQGTLAIMAGGSDAAFRRAGAVLRAYGRTIVHMGDVGAGTHAKLVNQLLTFAHGAAAAEAIAFAQHSRLNLEVLAEVLRASFGHSRMLDRTMTRVRDGNYEAGATLALYEKDMGIIAEVGAAHALQLPVMEAVRAILDAATRHGLGDRDIAALHLQYPAAAAAESRASREGSLDAGH